MVDDEVGKFVKERDDMRIWNFPQIIKSVMILDA
jgi:hypothetical protein